MLREKRQLMPLSEQERWDPGGVDLGSGEHTLSPQGLEGQAGPWAPGVAATPGRCPFSLRSRRGVMEEGLEAQGGESVRGAPGG